MIDDEFIWHKKGWEEYKSWINERNINMVSKIIDLIEDIVRSGLLKGLGKPERLKHYKKAVYSRRITDEHRLDYDIKDDRPRILSCKGHYEKKNFDEY